MSYDIYLFRTPPGRDAEEHFEELMEREGDWDGPSTSEMTIDPAMKRFADEFNAALNAEAMCDAQGEFISINVPYHYDGDHARDVFARIAACIRNACQSDGLTAYDPQLGRRLDVDRDLEAVLGGNAKVRRAMNDVLPRDQAVREKQRIAASMKKPWWKFW